MRKAANAQGHDRFSLLDRLPYLCLASGNTVTRAGEASSSGSTGLLLRLTLRKCSESGPQAGGTHTPGVIVSPAPGYGLASRVLSFTGPWEIIMNQKHSFVSNVKLSVLVCLEGTRG